MWSSKRGPIQPLTLASLALVGILVISGCTVEPLNASRSTALSISTKDVLKSMDVAPVSTRVAQQVRNKLLFSLNGGRQQSGGAYRVSLTVTSSSYALSVEVSSLAPTSSRVSVTARYTISEIATGKSVGGGSRNALASFDRTAQSFANERALRNAENRAALEVAQQLRLAIAKDITGL